MNLRKEIRSILRDFLLNWGENETQMTFNIYYHDGSQIRISDDIEPFKIKKQGIKNIVYVGTDWNADFFGEYELSCDIPYENYE